LCGVKVFHAFGHFYFLDLGGLEMKKLWLGILATLLVVVFVAPSFAWEFSMTGEFEYRLRYFSRTGNQDLFGDAGVQNNPAVNANWSSDAGLINPTTQAPPGAGALSWDNEGYMPAAANANYVGFAGPNIYRSGYSAPTGAPVLADTAAAAGVIVTRGGFSRWGCDALYNDQRLTFVPSIRVNNAIRIHGVYTVGGFRHKYAQTTIDANGDGAIGVPPFERYYMSQTSDAAYNTAAIGSWEQVRATIQTPIAVWSIGIKDFPFGTGSNLARNTRAEAFLTVVPYGPFRFLHGIWLARGTKGARTLSWRTHPDKDTKADIFQGILMTYDNGPISLGCGWIYQMNHSDRWLTGTFGQDNATNQYQAFMKYNNGRFFANAEYYWLTSDTTRLGASPRYAEGYNWFSEAGVMAGPGRLSLMYAQSSGPVLNNGNVTKTYVSNQINYQVLEPYSYLMFPIYGGGNDTFNNDGTGQMSDALVLAARGDYAAAANLNLFATYMWARRLEAAGYYAGGKATSVNTQGGVPVQPFSTSAATAQNWKAAALGVGGAANLNPYVDDNFLGWEAQAGLDWKLLENFSMQAKYAYWAPGEWFNQAYRVVNGTPLGLSGQGIMNGRNAIQAIHGSMTIDF
jgi:hypothetical protein